MPQSPPLCLLITSRNLGFVRCEEWRAICKSRVQESTTTSWLGFKLYSQSSIPYTASRQKRALIINLPCGVDRSTELVLMIAALPEIHATVRALQEIGKEWNQGETHRRNGICAYPGYRLRSTLIKICQGGGFLLDND